MSDMVKISTLPVTTTVSGVDILPIVQGGITKRIAENDFNSAASILMKLKTVDGADSGLDADTASKYGIGIMNVSTITDLNDYFPGGKYLTPVLHTMSHVPSWLGPSDYRALIDVVGNSSYAVQVITRTDGVCGLRIFNGVSWNDDVYGNGGQPPAPKPTTGTPAAGANKAGQYLVISTVSAGFTLPGNGSDFWEFSVICIISATGVIVPVNTGAGILAGGNTLTCASGQQLIGHAWNRG